jgi:hypothetical protein
VTGRRALRQVTVAGEPVNLINTGDRLLCALGTEPTHVDKLAGEVGDAVRFVQYARNLVAHPGKHVMGTPWLSVLGEDEYTIVYGVTRQVIDQLHASLPGPSGTT